MGRFEKQPDNPRVRGDLSRAAENALWAVVEDLENLQQHVLRSLQEEVKRLQAEKNRLNDDIKRLHEEKEHLQQVRQITEQQVLIRQLAEALAKHISSQLQSSLTTLATQTLEQNSHEYERAVLETVQTNSNQKINNNENVEQLLGSLDDTLTITFNSLQQELKNYQSNLSQQLSRMHNQQQQGEEILAELINRLQGLQKTIEATPPTAAKVSPPTILQPPEPQAAKVSPPTILQPSEPQAAKVSPPTILQPSEPQAAKVSPPTILQPSEPQQNISFESSLKLENGSSNVAEPISVIAKDLPESETKSQPQSLESPPEAILPSARGNGTEPISVISQDLSESETTPEPTLPSLEVTPPTVKKKLTEPISVFSRDLSENEIKPQSALRSPTAGAPAPSRKRGGSTPPKLPSSTSLSPIQIGFLLVVLSTVMSSLYNVAIKVIFHQGSEILGVVEVERLLAPTLGNTLLILMLRLLVVVPLMLLLAPMMHPRVWQDLQSLFESVRGNSTSRNVKTLRVLQLSIASGCCLFLSQVLIYIAVGQVTTGMAIALFFVYPLISGLLSWLLFRDRPNLFRAAAIGSLFCGELLVLAGSPSTPTGNVSLGSGTAILAGVAFAFYVILTRICASKLHPVSFTLINFATMLLLSFIGLMLPLSGDLSLAVVPSKLLEIILSAFILGVLTLCGYVLNHVGIRKLGASRSAIIGASVPFLTVIFAGLIIQENLEIVQILGVLLVTFGAAAFSFEQLRNQVNSSNSAN
ncbi:MAG: EamA family transporter [Mojavia pulchra JT2-VF2]|jgi:drug/metabolite transporter (DMT)-like permease/uncharacterized protein (UPF0335 family)/uncharacterized protein (DUF1330 family)|uniref:EamA family transporter n=1 Tax=Mojavia pulchra JT2-VF2 TaxID=287848 RepID=A0A951PWK0_9NOST|nr:EamA family transporter [Mojavia pulchra JT2-VF2]